MHFSQEHWLFMVYIFSVIGCELTEHFMSVKNKCMWDGMDQCKDAHKFGLSLDKHLHEK